MDSSAPTQSAPGAAPQQPAAPPQPSPEDQAAAARGDIPMPVTTSAQAMQQADAQEQLKVTEVQKAQSVNADKTAKEVTGKATAMGGAKLDDGGKSENQIKELVEKVENAPLPEEFKGEVRQRLERLEMIRASAGFLSSTFIMEYEATERFVDWICKMPWNTKSKDLLDMKRAKEIMDKNHYGLEPLKNRILEYIATVMLNLKNYGNAENAIKSPILCVVGLAGTGKTTFAKSLAEALGRSFERIPFGGMADSRVLRGQSRFFPDAEPGQIIKRMVNAKAKNPVICLDELDRVTDTARADIMGVLIEILDPEQNAKFTDHYVDYPFSLQDALFIATANNVSSVATAVLDRIEIIHMPSYNDTEKIVIGRDYVLPKTMQLTGLLPGQLIIDNEVWGPLVRPLGYDPGIRGLDRLITTICRKAATQIVTGNVSTVKVTNDNIKKFLAEW